MTDVLPSPCSSDLLGCRPVAGDAELAVHHRIRRAVFVEEQRLFAGSDADGQDAHPATVHVLGFVAGEPVGTVRLYPQPAPAEPGLWKGDRLAVLRAHRRSGIGGPLVRLAVATAGALGGTRMVATVQAANTAFFLDLGWDLDGPVTDHLGMPHQPMTIALSPGALPAGG